MKALVMKNTSKVPPPSISQAPFPLQPGPSVKSSLIVNSEQVASESQVAWCCTIEASARMKIGAAITSQNQTRPYHTIRPCLKRLLNIILKEPSIANVNAAS
ncbi:hypothetical protein [Filimonas effusa]|uniref:Uncharacterized protein n=1 Tax=Filimonas effusa TaxID=2508721 RepID=A0A4Q1D6W7_9BACT|nr:hypothetical protein [Filimonas effusa]RXK83776.1 hypothetical protein ESB13_17025 [Filimonas effusa]